MSNLQRASDWRFHDWPFYLWYIKYQMCKYSIFLLFRSGKFMFEVTLMGVVGVVLLKLLTLIDYSYIKLHFSIMLS